METSFHGKMREQAEALGFALTEQQAEQLRIYYEMLVEKNKVMNLTAITEEDEVISKHFTDSLSLVRCLSPEEQQRMASGDCSLLDLGTGAGLPGMVLKIAFPGLKVTLFDSLKKRLLFLEEVIARLDLPDIRTVHGRAEDFGRDRAHREKYDYVTSRAVANLSVLSEYCLPFVKPGGSFIAYKTAEYQAELAAAGKAIKVLGGGTPEEQSFLLPGTDIGRSLIRIRKVSPTPASYPRRAGIPARDPIGKAGT